MKRRVLNALTVLSLLACLAILALWVAPASFLGPRGHRSFRMSTGSGAAQTNYSAGTDSRALAFEANRLTGTQIPGPSLPANGISTPEILSWQQSLGPSDSWRLKGFSWESTPLVGTDAAGKLWMLGRQTVVRIPHWALLLTCAILPACHWLSRDRRRRQTRLKRGHCPNCDYDLRASDGRCPECGASVPECAASTKHQPS